MLKFLLRRFALALVTLWLLSVIVFALARSCRATSGATFSAASLPGFGRRVQQQKARPPPP